MNGRVDFKSELEKGTEFIIKFTIPDGHYLNNETP
jgi:hypothetical protein